jgi:hypothetical protein
MFKSNSKNLKATKHVLSIAWQNAWNFLIKESLSIARYVNIIGNAQAAEI